MLITIRQQCITFYTSLLYICLSQLSFIIFRTFNNFQSMFWFKLFLLNIFLYFTAAEISTFMGITGAVFLSGFYAVRNNCYSNECCKNPWIHFYPSVLSKCIKEDLYGQHLADLIIPRTLQGFIQQENPKKALVMSFHGPTGSGKNHVSKMIAKSLYKNGMDSQYVHMYTANKDFPHKSEIKKYQNRLREEIAEYTKLCGRSLFIFDEVDKMPPRVLDALKPYLDYHDKIDEVDYRRNIFIFLSNDGGDSIMKIALEFWRDGKEREEITMKKIEPLIRNGVFNERGGLQFSEIVQSALIDAYIPFLPLEKKHVKQCIVSELKSRYLNTNSDRVARIADELEYVPDEVQLYSVSGCKRVSAKIDVFGDLY